MSESAITATVVTDALKRLNAAFNDYLEKTKKDPTAALITRGQFLTANLYQAFAATSPAPGAILSAAVARGWRMGRKGIPSGISATTWKRVYSLMQGNKSILAYTVPGTAVVQPVRVGWRGKFVTDRARKKVVASQENAVAAYKATKGIRLSGMRSVGRALGAKILNRRAVAVALEIQLREQGRKFLGVSWLYRRWRQLAQSDPDRVDGAFRKLVNNNPRSTITPLGEVQLTTGDQSATLRISSNVPGIDSAFASEIIARVLNEETSGIEAYLLRKSTERLMKAISIQSP